MLSGLIQCTTSYLFVPYLHLCQPVICIVVRLYPNEIKYLLLLLYEKHALNLTSLWLYYRLE